MEGERRRGKVGEKPGARIPGDRQAGGEGLCCAWRPVREHEWQEGKRAGVGAASGAEG